MGFKLTKNQKKSIKGIFSKAVIIVVFYINWRFGHEVIEVFRETGVEPATLIEYWFKFSIFEMVCLAGIKITKTMKNGGDTL